MNVMSQTTCFLGKKQKNARFLNLQSQQVKKKSHCHEAFMRLFLYRRYEEVIHDRFVRITYIEYINLNS